MRAWLNRLHYSHRKARYIAIRECEGAPQVPPVMYD